jgi:hypothetical protein
VIVLQLLFGLLYGIAIFSFVGLVLGVPLIIVGLLIQQVARLWRWFNRPPPVRRQPAFVRAADHDREEAVATLRESYAAGRLAVQELGERTRWAYAARTWGDLDRLTRDLPRRKKRDPLGRYRPLLYAACAYNVLWGGLNVVAPTLFAHPLGLHGNLVLWQALGMLVLVVAPLYWWAARRPERNAHLVAVALLGKLLGPLGFLAALATGSLSPVFGWTILANDVLWWPVLALFLREAARLRGGWRVLLAG